MTSPAVWTVLVCGSREWTNRDVIIRELHELPLGRLIHGNCRGADKLAAEIGRYLGWKVEPFPADWKALGKKAGPLRNRQMLDEKPDLVLAFHAGIERSKGTADCVQEANRRGLKWKVVCR